jgi:hypothetical protein
MEEDEVREDFQIPTEIYSTQDDTLGYEWNELHVYVRTFGDPKWRYYIDIDSGCSCDYYDPPDWPNVNNWDTREDVIREFNQWNGFESPMNKTRELERLIQAMNKAERSDRRTT